jgi:mannosylglycerate hydrolase
MIEAIRRGHPGVEVRVGSYDDYVAALEPRIDDLPVVEGELRSGRDAHILRGIDSVRMPLKQANDRIALRLLTAEAVASLALLRARSVDRGGRSATDGAAGQSAGRRAVRPDPGPGLDRAWKLLLRNQPHDSISGCSVDPVHREMEARFAVVDQLAERIERESVAALGDSGLTWDPPIAGASAGSERQASEVAVSVVNPLPQSRTVLLEAPLSADLARGQADLVAEIGPERAIVPVQHVDGHAAIALQLGGFAVRAVRIRSRRPGESGDAASPWPAAAPARTIENDRFRVTAAEDGTFSVEDRSSGRVSTGLAALDDVADRGDEYTFCPLEGEAGRLLALRNLRVRVVRSGPVLSELEVAGTAFLPARLSTDRRRRTGRVACAVRTVARLVAGSDRVAFATTIDNRARDHRLRLRFPAPDASPEVRAEGHFAVIRRAVRPDPPSNPAVWAELPQPASHTTGFVACGSLVVVGHGLPEYEAIERAGGGVEVALTLLRSVGWLSRDDLSTRPGGAGPAVETPDAQLIGSHRFEYDVRLDGDLDDASLVRASADARWPVAVGPPGLVVGSGAEEPGLPRVRGNVAFAALKLAEHGEAAILRIYNPGRERTPFAIDSETATAWRIRLDETPHPDPALPETLGPGEILTVRLEPLARS